jgi:hypothetical protein
MGNEKCTCSIQFIHAPGETFQASSSAKARKEDRTLSHPCFFFVYNSGASVGKEMGHFCMSFNRGELRWGHPFYGRVGRVPIHLYFAQQRTEHGHTLSSTPCGRWTCDRRSCTPTTRRPRGQQAARRTGRPSLDKKMLHRPPAACGAVCCRISWAVYGRRSSIPRQGSAAPNAPPRREWPLYLRHLAGRGTCARNARRRPLPLHRQQRTPRRVQARR